MTGIDKDIATLTIIDLPELMRLVCAYMNIKNRDKRERLTKLAEREAYREVKDKEENRKTS